MIWRLLLCEHDFSERLRLISLRLISFTAGSRRLWILSRIKVSVKELGVLLLRELGSLIASRARHHNGLIELLVRVTGYRVCCGDSSVGKILDQILHDEWILRKFELKLVAIVFQVRDVKPVQHVLRAIDHWQWCVILVGLTFAGISAVSIITLGRVAL